MSRKGFRYDMNKCLECRACVVSCKDKNDLPVGVNFNAIEERERGKFPDVFVWFTLKMCRHCDNAPCVAKCPTGAMTKDDDTGMVYVKEDVCIGCGMCEKSCPYNAVHVRDDTKKAAKCNGCIDMQKRGEIPVCVASCTGRCLTFDDVDKLRADDGLVRAVNDDVSPEITQPNLYYKPKKGLKA